MRLYCWRCKEHHELTDLEVRKLIYSLQGDLADSLLKPIKLVYQPEEDAVACIRDQMNFADDVEMFYEWVESILDSDLGPKCVECGDRPCSCGEECYETP